MSFEEVSLAVRSPVFWRVTSLNPARGVIFSETQASRLDGNHFSGPLLKGGPVNILFREKYIWSLGRSTGTERGTSHKHATAVRGTVADI